MKVFIPKKFEYKLFSFLSEMSFDIFTSSQLRIMYYVRYLLFYSVYLFTYLIITLLNILSDIRVVCVWLFFKPSSLFSSSLFPCIVLFESSLLDILFCLPWVYFCIWFFLKIFYLYIIVIFGLFVDLIVALIITSLNILSGIGGCMYMALVQTRFLVFLWFSSVCCFS